MKQVYRLAKYCHVFLLPYLGKTNTGIIFGDCQTIAGITIIRIKYDLPDTMKTTWHHEMSHFTEFMLDYHSRERVSLMVETIQRRAAKVLPFLKEDNT